MEENKKMEEKVKTDEVQKNEKAKSLEVIKQGNQPKSKRKPIIISLLIIMFIGLGIGGYFIYENVKLKEPIKENWGQKYYMYLKDINEKNKEEEAGLPKDINNSKLSFYEIENISDPVMVINYEKDQNNYSNVYYIYNDKVNVLNYKEPTIVEFLYHIENKKYNYYSHTKTDKKNKYKSISQQITERIDELNKAKDNSEKEKIVEENTEYTFTDESVEKITNLEGKEIVLTDFDKTFVKPNVKEKYINYSSNLQEKELKNIVTKEIDQYETKEEIVTEKIDKQVEKRVTEVENTKQEIASAKEAIEKKEAEEKAKREAEEKEKAEREGFKVGSYTLKYGRYEWDLAELGSPGQKETIILRSDKTCTHTDYEGKTNNCTFSVGTATDGQSIESAVVRPALKINAGTYTYSYFPTSQGFRDTDLENFKYMGSLSNSVGGTKN